MRYAVLWIHGIQQILHFFPDFEELLSYMNAFIYHYPAKAAQTSFCKMIFITTQRNQLMIPVSSCIFSTLCNKKKPKVRTRVSLNSQTAYVILKNKFSSKKPCCWNWLFSLSRKSLSLVGHFMQRSDRPFKYLTKRWTIIFFCKDKRKKTRESENIRAIHSWYYIWRKIMQSHYICQRHQD